MFEKYTEAARKIIFFERYEASQLGGEYIDTEHLLLGVFRSDPPLARRVLKDPRQIRSIREEVERQSSQRDKVSVSVDLPLTQTSKTVLTRAAKEAELANHPNICPGHLFLALILVEECAAAKILLSNGVTAAQLKHEIMNPDPANLPEAGPVLVPRVKPPSTQIVPQYRDLTLEAREGKLSPLIGRERELESIVRILSRRNRCYPVLIGEPGVGKDRPGARPRAENRRWRRARKSRWKVCRRDPEGKRTGVHSRRKRRHTLRSRSLRSVREMRNLEHSRSTTCARRRISMHRDKYRRRLPHDDGEGRSPGEGHFEVVAVVSLAR